MTKKRQEVEEYYSPRPRAYSLTPAKTPPEALQTELTTLHQIRKDEGTLIWGNDDALPLHIFSAIAESPTTTSCIGKIEMYTKGSKFSDEGLMTMPIDKNGTTLWDLHCQIIQYYVSLDGFTTNFKFDSDGKITNTYCMAMDGVRLMAQAEQTQINSVKYNPYFGSGEYRRQFSVEYPLYNPDLLQDQIKKMGTKFQGQVYFHATKRPLYKHYPVPKFWAGKKWIYSDGKMATYVDELLDNGFFQSALMNVIGDPNVKSKDPRYQNITTGTDGTKRNEPTKTEGEVFDMDMAENFSGVKKAGTVMVKWAKNKDQVIDIQAFPSNIDFAFLEGTLTNTIRMIAISTEVPAILANLPDSASPLSGQDALPKAIDFMQSNTAYRRNVLENFYNTILIPNMQKSTKARVKIEQYSPTKITVPVDKNFWEFMNEAEKIDFITKNEPNITMMRPPVATDNTAPATTDEKGNPVPAPTAPQVDEILKGFKVSEINKIMSYVKKYERGTLTLDQVTQLLHGFGLSDEQITAWINPTIEP